MGSFARALGIAATLGIGSIANGCPERSTTTPEAAASRDAREDGSLLEVRTAADVARLDGKRVVVIGRYDVEPVHEHRKGGRLTFIVLDDGTFVSRSYGLFPREMRFVDKRVHVIGVVTKGPPDPMMQSLGGPHVRVDRIELAPGEVETTPTPTDVPTPPNADDEASLTRREGRWVTVHGAVTGVRVDGGTDWADATLKLSDGYALSVKTVLARDWSPHVGASVTVIGRVHTDPRSSVRALVAAGPPCRGVVARCGMKPVADGD